MSTTMDRPRSDEDAPEVLNHKRIERPESLRDLAKFAGLAGVLAMFCDAAVGHALLWENDPFWTYWATDTFLIAAVFGIGTALIGLGVARGAVLAGVQAVALTIYYWTFAPIHLPSSPEWLDLEHTWVTGVPVHFGVYYLGYLAALWLWRRRTRTTEEPAPTSLRAEVGSAIAVGAAVVILAGVIQWIALGEAPGATWFVQRVVIATVFTVVWWAAAGRDRVAAVGGAITLSFILLTYSHFLGPVGLPDTDVRLVAPDSPPATSHWLSWSDEWLVAFPITLAVALAVYLVASARSSDGWSRPRLEARQLAGSLAALLLILGVGVVAAIEGGPDDHVAEISSVGPDSEGDADEIRLVAQDRNPRVTPLPPHDVVDLRASIEEGGVRYDVTATAPRVADPRGRFTTWGGVGFDKWVHGRSGIGLGDRPAVRAEVAVFALGDVDVDGELVARGVPIDAYTLDDGGVALHVGEPDSPLVGVGDGQLVATWANRTGDSPEGHQRAHNILGSVVLVALIVLVATSAQAERRRI